MSDNKGAAPSAGAPMAAAVNNAVAAAKDLPELIDKVSAVDPGLAKVMTGQALVASKTPWGTLLAAAVAWGAAKYGLNWSPEVCDLVAGAGVLAGAYLMRYISPGRVTGVFTKTPVTTNQGTTS